MDWKGEEEEEEKEEEDGKEEEGRGIPAMCSRRREVKSAYVCTM
jgi:hypothetical protein